MIATAGQAQQGPGRFLLRLAAHAPWKGHRVAVATAGGRRSLIGMVLAAIQSRARSKGRPSRVAKFAAVAREHVVTVAALASVDLGCFRASDVAGFIVLGASLVTLQWAVTGR